MAAVQDFPADKNVTLFKSRVVVVYLIRDSGGVSYVMVHKVCPEVGSVGECIDGSNYSKSTYMEELTTGMDGPLSNGDDHVDVKNKIMKHN